MKLHVISFGCQMSFADGEEMSRPLLAKGFAPTAALDEADAVLVNTCTVRQHAEDKALSQLGRLAGWKAARPERFLIVAGCAAERLGPWIRRRFPHVDLVVGAKSIEQYPDILEEALNARFPLPEKLGTDPDFPGKLGSVPNFSPEFKSSAYVTIMRGCNYSCTYCIVPAVRGREIYRPLEAVLADCRARVAEGAKEIMFLGQTVNSYRDGAADFAQLLAEASKVAGLERIRFMSPHPFFINERMIRAIAESPKVCRHLHLPLQSGCDRVLKAMRRNYTAVEFLDKAARLRELMPDLVITTDVIAGFPGETEEDFEQTLDVVKRLDPASAYCFKFSPRPGTQATTFGGQIEEAEIERRLARLLELVDGRIESHLASWRGRRVKLLLEDERFGRTEHFFKARLETPSRPGEIVAGEVVGNTPTTLQVKLLETLTAV